MVEIDNVKIIATGNSMGFRIPKALVTCKVLDQSKFYKITIEEVQKPYKEKSETSDNASVALRWASNLLNELFSMENNILSEGCSA